MTVVTATAPATRRPRRLAAALVLGAAASAALALSSTADAAVFRGRAVAAPDGDTLVLATRAGRVRVDLAGILAPLPGECQANAARRRLRALAVGKVVRVETTGRRRGNRVRGLVFTPGGSGAAGTLNRRLVALGLAEANVPRGLRFGRAIGNAEADAEDAGRGIWGAACGGVEPGGGGGAVTPPAPTPPPAPAPTPPPAANVLPNVPAGWVVLGGTAATIPLTGTPDEITQKRTTLNTAYTNIDARVRAGRVAFFFESLGNAAVVNSDCIIFTSPTAYTRTESNSGISNTLRQSSGTWRVTVDFRTLDGVVPTLELTEATASAAPAPSLVSFRLDADPAAGSSKVFLGSRTFTTGPGTSCN